MSSAIDKLEQRILELGRKMEQLRGENESFRNAAVAGQEQQVSSEQALAQIETLKLENSQLRQKLDAVDKRLAGLIDGVEKMGDGGKA